MAMTMQAPNFRAASGDLTIAISPLGLVELADEEDKVFAPPASHEPAPGQTDLFDSDPTPGVGRTRRIR